MRGRRVTSVADTAAAGAKLANVYEGLRVVRKSRRRSASDEVPAETVDRPTRRRIRWLLLVLVVLGGLWGIGWYGRRSLREAERAFRAGDMQTAAQQLALYLDQHPENPRALSLKARMLVMSGRPADAIAIFERVGPASAEDFHAWAKAHLMREEWTPALPLLTQVVALQPENADAWYELTACRMRLGYLEEALESAQQYLQAGVGQQARAHVFLGTIHNDLGNRESAAKAYAQVLEYDPDARSLQVSAEDFFLEYARTLSSLARLDEARTMAERSLAASATPDAATLLGNIHAQAGRADEAQQSWQRAVEMDPRHVAAREALATAALARGAGSEALRWLEPLAGQANLMGTTAYLLQRTHTLLKNEQQATEWGQRAAQLRETERIVSAVDSVLVDAPQSFWARVIRAYRFALAGNWRQAELMVDQLRREAPNEPFVTELAQALDTRGALPPLTKLPLVQK